MRAKSAAADLFRKTFMIDNFPDEDALLLQARHDYDDFTDMRAIFSY